MQSLNPTFSTCNFMFLFWPFPPPPTVGSTLILGFGSRKRQGFGHRVRATRTPARKDQVFGGSSCTHTNARASASERARTHTVLAVEQLGVVEFEGFTQGDGILEINKAGAAELSRALVIVHAHVEHHLAQVCVEVLEHILVLHAIAVSACAHVLPT
jgi:hypothetical protein